MKKITMVTGMYGSGKSEFCVNLAIHASRQGYKVYLADVDVINVYFRSREASELLSQYGIEVLGNVLGHRADTDMPHFSANFARAFTEENSILIFDLAGSEVGLRMLPSFLEKYIDYEYDFLNIVNIRREDSSNSKAIENYIEFVNSYSDFKINGLVNNTNLINFTTVDDLLAGQKELLQVPNLEVKYVFLNEKNDSKELVGKKIIFKELILRKQWQ